MDEQEYKSAYKNLVHIPCVFEKSVLSCRVSCSKSCKQNLAEREVVSCSCDACQSICAEWLPLLRIKAQFALQLKELTSATDVLPHAKEMKVQVGGIHGLSRLIQNPESDFEVNNNDKTKDDVFVTLSKCLEIYGKFDKVPFEEILKSVASFKLR